MTTNAIETRDRSMYIVLLSGGSGKRLWPLSNASRSKQFIKLLRDPETGAPCSMIQRVWGQLKTFGLADKTVICASAAQVELIQNQLKDVHIAIESARRDTYPAVALSCLYLRDRMGAAPDDIVCVLPVDPYADAAYFETLSSLPEILKTSGGEIALMGVQPTEPSTKLGYIVPSQNHGRYLAVDSFREKPDEAAARQLIAKGALWNCGVFCLQIRTIFQSLSKYGIPAHYDAVFKNYDRLPKISFDYEVLERCQNLVAVGFNGLWKDLGTWNALSGEMAESSIGYCLVDPTCENTHVINETDLPVAAVGTRDLVVVSSYDGVLVAHKDHTERIKDITGGLERPPMYEERRWGSIKVLDMAETGDGMRCMTRKVHMLAGQNLSYHSHEHREEVWTLLSGKAVFLVNGKHRELWSGDSIHIGRGAMHTFQAKTELTLLEVQVGSSLDDTDTRRAASQWDEIEALAAVDPR